jgi:hypothetical protein
MTRLITGVELRGLEPLTPTLPGVGTLPEQARCHDADPVVAVAGAGAVVSVVVNSVVSALPRCPPPGEVRRGASSSKYGISAGKYRVSHTTPGAEVDREGRPTRLRADALRSRHRLPRHRDRTAGRHRRHQTTHRHRRRHHRHQATHRRPHLRRDRAAPGRAERDMRQRCWP